MTEPPSGLRPSRWHSIFGFRFSRRQLIRATAVVVIAGIALGLTFAAWYRPPRATRRLIQSAGGSVEYQREPNVLVQQFAGQQFRRLGLVPADEEIERVGLLQSSVSDDWLHHLKGLDGLKILDLHERQLGPGLAELKGLPGLSSVGVYGLCDGDLKHLQALPNLREIRIGQPKCPDVDLSKLSSLTKLGSLSLSFRPVTARQLEQVSRISSLHALDLQSATIPQSELSGLAHLAALTKLETLYVGDVSDEGIAHITKLNSLQYLCFCGARLTDEGLVPLSKLRNLKDLRLSGCTGAFNVEMLRRNMPKCRSRVDPF